MEVQQLCIQSLANFSANNRRNKEFLCQMDILTILKRLLFDTEAMLDDRSMMPPAFVEVLEDIQENALTAIKNLFSGHCYEQDVQQQLLQNNGAEFFLRKLQQMRPALVRKSLLVGYYLVRNPCVLRFCRRQPFKIPIFRCFVIRVFKLGGLI